MYVHFEHIHVDLPNRIQLCAWKIYGNGCIRYLGCDGDRLGIPGNVFRDPVFQRKLEEKCDCIGQKTFVSRWLLVTIEKVWFIGEKIEVPCKNGTSIL